MKNKTESNWEMGLNIFGILRSQDRFGILPTYNQYETVVPYDEERDRWTFRTKDTVKPQANPINQQMKMEKALTEELAKGQQGQRSFWFRLFGQKA